MIIANERVTERSKASAGDQAEDAQDLGDQYCTCYPDVIGRSVACCVPFHWKRHVLFLCLYHHHQLSPLDQGCKQANFTVSAVRSPSMYLVS